MMNEYPKLFEADDEEPTEEETKDSGSEEETVEDGQTEDDSSGNDAESVDDAPFPGLDLRTARCFGFQQPTKNSWLYIAKQAKDTGWQLNRTSQLEKSLTRDVEMSYFNIAEYTLKNLEDSVSYSLTFDNNKALWQVEITKSPDAEMSIEERADFFKSDMFQKISKKTYFRLNEAKEIYEDIVKQHLDNGELMLVDEVKLNAILKFLETEYFMQNILNGKYLSY